MTPNQIAQMVIAIVVIVMWVVFIVIMFKIFHSKKLTEEDIQKKNPIKGNLRVIDDEDGRHLFLDLTSEIDVKQKTIIFTLTYIDLVNYKSYSQKKNGEFVKR